MSSKPLVAVVFATYNRRALLARSLEAYARQDFDNDRLEIVCVDDHSGDGTIDLVKDWGRRTGIRYQIVIPGPKAEAWQDCAAVINAGIRATTAKNIVLTHPECIPSKQTVRRCLGYLEANPGGYFGAKVYYMGVRDQELIDTVPWLEQGAHVVNTIPGFYDEDENGHPDYKHAVTDLVGTPGFRIPTWESWVWGGVTRDLMRKLGGFPRTTRWGSVDIIFNNRRKDLGIPTYTPPDLDAVVVHQNHSGPNDTPSPRVETLWHKEVDEWYAGRGPNDLCWPNVDELGWLPQGRPRANP